jgi:hypothetical protein
MMNLRSVGALLAISAALSCATAINQDAGVEPSPMAGSDSGGGAGLAEEGGAPAGGAPQQAGAPGSAGKGGAASGGAPGAAGKGGGGSGGKGGGTGSGGTAGVAGSSTGGKAGTGSSGTGGSSAGAAGGGSTGPCEGATELPTSASGNTGNFNKLGAACFRTKSTFNNIGCSNFEGRTLKVNNVAVVCPALNATFAPAIDGWTYLDASAGTNVSASIYWYTS